MRSSRRGAESVESYGIAVGAVLAAFGATYATWPLLQPTPWALFFAAVMAGAWFGSMGASLLATALAAILGNIYFIAPFGAASIDQGGLVATGTFLVVSLLIGVLASARRRAEAFERAERKRFQATMVSIGDAVIATDARGRVTFMNGVAEDLTGWPADEAGGKPLDDVFDIINEESRAPVVSPVAKVLETGRIQGLANHTVLIARDGTERPIDDSASPIRDDVGTLSGVVLVFRDISERKVAEADRARLAAIVESSDDAIVGKTLDGIIRSWNAGAGRVFGYSAAEAVGQPITLIVPPDRLDEERGILERLRRGERVEHFETLRVTKDGRRVDISLTVSPIRDSAGRVIGASKIARDVTTRKAAEDELRENDRQKDEFLAMLAHELRNPLSAVNNAVTLLKVSDNPEHVAFARGVIGRQLQHLTRLIDDLLDVSRISRGKIALRRGVVEATPILDSAAECVTSLVEERKHTLEVAIDRGQLWVDADPTRLEQIVVNLLNNAAKYSENAGRIRLSAFNEGAEVVIRVEDEGVGIPPEKLPKMFELFAQGDRSLARSEGGLGIGLTVVKNLVELHGGSVTAHSEGLGRGSTFTIRIPAATRPAADLSSDSPSPGSPERRAKILVVDDNEDTARGMSRLLKLLGHDVETAYSGPKAIEVARDYHPELILLDIGLPGMDGYQVASRLRQEACCKDSVLIAVSGYGQEDDRRRSREAGFDYHLIKPIDHDALRRLISAGARP